jgi:Zn-finger nucleic acid-binding protein
MFENLGSRRASLVRARAEAEKRSNVCVEPVHLLLALLDDDAVAGVLRKRQVSIESIRLEAAALAAQEPSVPGIEQPPLSASVKRVLELAALEAHEGGHKIVLSEHLLLGLVRLERPAIVDMFRRFGITLDVIRPLIPSGGASPNLEVPAPVQTLLAKLTLRDLEKKGFRKAKELRAGDVNQLILKVVQTVLAKHSTVLSPEDNERILAEAKAEYERLTRLLQVLQDLGEKQAAIQESKPPSLGVQIDLQIGLIEKLLAEKKAVLEERKALEREREKRASGAPACPLGHGVMDEVVREGVRLAVCPECLGTFLAPGQLDALVKKLSELSPDALHRFLEPDEPTDPT